MVVATSHINTLDELEELESGRPQITRLRKSAAAALRRRERKPTSDWATETIWMSPMEATSGQYDLSDRPWWREVLDACNDPDVETVSIMAATQVGKTLMSIIAALAMSDIAPVPGMIVTPDFTSCVELRDRIYALAEESPKLRHRIPNESDRNMRHVDLKNCRVYLAYSGARQRLRGRPVGWVFMTEIDVYRGDTKGGDPIAAASERVKAFFRFKIIMESSPGDDPSPIAKAYENSDGRSWHCQCPHCGHHQEVRFFTLKAGEKEGKGGIVGYRNETDDRLLSVEEARRKAYYLCEHGCKITNDQKDEFLLSGQWVRRGQWIDEAGKLRGVPENPGRARGYHLWSIMSPNHDFGSMAANYIKHYHDGKLSDFRKNWLGLPHSTQAKMPLWNVLGVRCSAFHKRGEVPDEAWFCTAAFDVQGDRVVYSVRAWGDQITSWGVDWGIIDRKQNEQEQVAVKSDLQQIAKHVLSRRWPVVNKRRKQSKSPHGLSTMGIRIAGIDSNYRVLHVHEWLRSLPEKQRKIIRAIRGDHHLSPAEPYRVNTLYESQREKVEYEGGLEQWGIYVNTFKEELADAFHVDPKGPGAFLFPMDIMTEGVQYLKQLVNEPKVTRKLPSGKTVREWKEKTHSIGHDYWDTEVYNRALAQIQVDELGIGWDATYWSRKRFDAPAVDVLASDTPAVEVVARDDYIITR